MADNTTGLPVQTLAGQFVETKLLDSAGTNVAAVSATGALSANVTHVGGDALAFGQAAMADSLPVTLASDQTALAVTIGTAVTVTGTVALDAPAAAINPVLVGTYASAAAPADVSADGDAVRLWALRNGAQVVNLAAAGTLVTFGQKTMANAFSVSIASDQSAVASNITQVGGATQSATNPLYVRLTDGASAYTASSGAPVDPKSSTQTSAALGAGASVTLTHYVTSGKTGSLMGVDVTSTVSIKAIVSKILTGAPTSKVVIFALAGQLIQWRSPHKSFITQDSADATSGFGVVFTNKDAAVAADVYSTAYWDEG